MNIRTLLNERFRSAMADAGIPPECQAHVAPGKKAGFGDYQANGAMAAGKIMQCKPREIAQNILDNLQLEGIAKKTEIAGPGFINIFLDPVWLARQVELASASPSLGVIGKAVPQTVVIDYSSPNLAKEMHVGHLRSTILGDTMARVLEFLGDNVIRQNHVGDWGTQFGMLIAELENQLSQGEKAELALSDLESFYQRSKKHFDDDPAFADLARDYVVRLQGGDKKLLEIWQKFREISLQHSAEIYQKLDVTLTPNDVYGESAYNNMLADVIVDLRENKLARRDKGALVAHLQELADKNGDPAVVIVQKSDGGYLYSTTDLAAVKYRNHTLKADRILYFIDARQSLHMQQVFTLARKAGFSSEWTSLEHHANGMILGADGTPFKTRDGGTVKLGDLLDESVERAEKIVREKLRERNYQLAENDIHEIARNVGIGAVKYADLSKTRTNDYVFNWEAMLRLDGNTGPYVQYAYTRICSIFRQANEDLSSFSGKIVFVAEEERILSKKLLRFAETIEQVAEEAYPHILCNYLYELAGNFMTFYEACPILKSPVVEEQKASRLQLSKAVAKTLKMGLNLLGIQVMEKM